MLGSVVAPQEVEVVTLKQSNLPLAVSADQILVPSKTWVPKLPVALETPALMAVMPQLVKGKLVTLVQITDAAPLATT
jgi:hypothetical protein